MKHLIAIAFSLCACVMPPPQDPQAPPEPAATEEVEPTYSEDEPVYSEEPAPSSGNSCGDLACNTDEDCPGSCGACSEWSKTCLLF